MNISIDRLRASKLEHEEREYKHGLVEGKLWTENRADYGELTRLEVYSEQYYGEEVYGPVSVAKGICSDGDETSPADFWEGAVGYRLGRDPHKDTEWYRGFVEGALEAFYEAQDQL